MRKISVRTMTPNTAKNMTTIKKLRFARSRKTRERWVDRLLLFRDLNIL
jgi:hypothetical protein